MVLNPDVVPGEKQAFIPLEANPELMTTLLRKLGLSSSLQVHDIYSLHDQELLQFVPRPANAVLLVFPVSATYESHRLAEDALVEDYKAYGEGEPVVWYNQTIRNACGLMGLLHAVSSKPNRDYIEKGSDLDKLVTDAIALPPAQRSELLEKSKALANAHYEAASQGASDVPEAEADVDLHYVCFTKTEDGRLWELDGRRKGPIERGSLEKDEDVLSEKALTLGPRKFIDREGADLRFTAVALAPSMD